MKIEKERFVKFLKKIRMDGKQKVEELVFDFGIDGVNVKATDSEKVVYVIGNLKRGAFSKYEEVGKVCVNQLNKLCLMSERFNETITLSVNGNLLKLKENNKEHTLPITDESIIKSVGDLPELTFSEVFELDSKKIKEIQEDVSIGENTELIIETEEKKVTFKNTGEYAFKDTLDMPSCKGGVKVKFGLPFFNAVKALEGKLQFSINTDYPAKIIETSDDWIVSVIVSPRVQDEE